MGNEMDDATTSQQSDAENPGQSDSGEGTNNAEESGAVQRINELTRKFREQERQNAALAAQNQELMQTLTQTVAQMSQRASQPAEAAPEFDPEEKKKFEYLLSPIQKQLQHVTAQLAVANVQGEIQSQLKPGTPPEVIQHATALLADWRKKGIPGNPQDAITYAMGQYVLGKSDEDATVTEQRRSLNGAAGRVQTGQGGQARRSTVKTLSEAEIERLSPQAQADYYASRLDPNEEF